jgi:ADP-ribosylglycohydrolase
MDRAKGCLIGSCIGDSMGVLINQLAKNITDVQVKQAWELEGLAKRNLGKG